jgi:hypothetical protein
VTELTDVFRSVGKCALRSIRLSLAGRAIRRLGRLGVCRVVGTSRALGLLVRCVVGCARAGLWCCGVSLRQTFEGIERESNAARCEMLCCVLLTLGDVAKRWASSTAWAVAGLGRLRIGHVNSIGAIRRKVYSEYVTKCGAHLRRKLGALGQVER